MSRAAWPALFCRETLADYLDGLCDATTRKVCPVRPVDLGANVLRYRKDEVDAWLASLPHRPLRKGRDGAQDGDRHVSVDAPAANDGAAAALERVRRRIGARG